MRKFKAVNYVHPVMQKVFESSNETLKTML